jgi:hypothetical protein
MPGNKQVKQKKKQIHKALSMPGSVQSPSCKLTLSLLTTTQ